LCLAKKKSGLVCEGENETGIGYKKRRADYNPEMVN
jgi:hypothetical protein